MSPKGKGGRYVGLTTLQLSCADCLEIWEPQPLGTLRACPDLYRDYRNYVIAEVQYVTLHGAESFFRS
jgi:hypothetical protein